MTTENNDEIVVAGSGPSPPLLLPSYDSKTLLIYQSGNYLLKFYPVLVLILGSFGNLLSFCVLLRAAMRRYSTFCYLACLALVDIGVILTFCVNFISKYHFDYDLQAKPFTCKLFAFSIYFLPQYSSWILVAVSFDRVISAKYIRLAKTWNQPKHSVRVTLILGLVLAILNGHFFYYENHSLKKQQQQTHMLNNRSSIEDFLSSESFTNQQGALAIMNSVSGSDSSLSYPSYTPVPAQIISRDTTLQQQQQYDGLSSVQQASSSSQKILSFEVNVIECSLENDPRLKPFYPYWSWIDLAMNVFLPFTAMIACTIVIIFTLIRSSNRAGSTSARRSRRRRNISVMLVTINLVFISLTAPIVIFLSLESTVRDSNNPYRESIVRLIKILCIILMNLNHSINIVIYSLTAKEFRLEMVNFLTAVLHCIIGKPTHPADREFLHIDDGTILSRLRHFHRNMFKCCRMKFRLNSTTTTDSSGAQPTTVPGRTSKIDIGGENSSVATPRRRNGKKKILREQIARNSEISLHQNSHRLTVQLQPDPISSVYEREDISFHGFSFSTED